ncbi:hypothetical protein GCM10007972_17050 [Iodidimonas muriae]|uniref:Uncharacterized protein n=1 Tax=Iodidimonas muriae TaxID=261467 RepID=A0ABQ2LDG1_9PROT|nr:hypothetical protein JCM17843_21310 [Kordiimonadales bacterium JCM 17843]GGO12284.1 hypothetical protein GCM10007972_17050 [Iodidimonas muriae]
MPPIENMGANESRKDRKKKEMVHLSRESSNYLFEVLSEWNQVLETIDDPVNDLEIDVHREVG